MKIKIIYWSGTGNTLEMAKLIASGATDAGSEVEMKDVSEASSGDVDGCDALVLGCPSMGAEVLEESEFEPFMESIERSLSGKKVALFGSYGWGDGEWMRNWVERLKNVGTLLVDDGLIVNGSPQGDAVELCKKFGEALVR